MKKTKRIVTALLLIAFLCMTGTQVLATGGFIDPGSLTGSEPSGSDIQDVGNTIIGIIQAVGSIVAVVVLLILGIKYMMGSAEEKAEYKKTLLPYFIGAIFVFGAGAITTIIFNMAGTDWTA